MDDDWANADLDLTGLFLIGKLILRKPFNIEAMRYAFKGAWHIDHYFELKEVGERLFLFTFKPHIDKAKLLICQPRSFNKALVAFREIDAMKKLNLLDVQHCPLRVQFH